MKQIRYKIPGYNEIYDPTSGKTEQQACLVEVGIPVTDANLAKAQAEAYNGEYTVEDNREPEATEPTQLDRVEAQVTYTAMMTDTLLEG